MWKGECLIVISPPESLFFKTMFEAIPVAVVFGYVSNILSHVPMCYFTPILFGGERK